MRPCGKIYMRSMESTNLKVILTPPSLMKSLMAGFDAVSNHIGLILFSVSLDLLLWFGPHVRIAKLFEPVFQQVAAYPEMESATTVDLLRAGAARLNLLSVLRTFPIGIPSLMAGRAPVETPSNAPFWLDITSYGAGLGLWLLFIITGLAVGTIYFSVVAQVTLDTKVNWRSTFSQWPWNFAQVILLALFWFFLISFFMIPMSCVLSILLLLGIGTAQFPLLIALFLGGVLVWLMIPLFFSPHGIFTKHRPMWNSLVQAVRLSRSTFSTTGMLILAVVVLSEGMDVLWNVPAENSWLMLVGIAGHAFITTGLLAATYVYYRDADLWLEQLIQQRQAGVIGGMGA
jgi:hypothetical protein